MPQIRRTHTGDPDFLQLVRMLDQDLAIRDGDDHAFYAQFNKLDKTYDAVLICIDNKAVGCGAIRPYSDDTMEVKRMFVLPELRGRGIGAMLLNELECWTREKGFRHCILETGKNQPEAIRLYQKCGYRSIPNYGQYELVENSVCFEKMVAEE